MKFYVQLPRLLTEHNYRFRDIARETSLTTYRVRELCNSARPNLNREVIEKVCDFLVGKGIARRDELPALLFAPAPEQFWELLFPRSKVTLCMGVRHDPKYKDQLVSAADAVLQSKVLYKWTDMAFRKKNQPPQNPGSDGDTLPALPIIDTRLIDAWYRPQDDLNRDHVIPQAQECYDAFATAKGDRALICFGSIKSNPVIECVTANCFHTAPFVSSDTVNKPNDRPCPFMFAYREKDPQPESICGGLKLSKRDNAAHPGIHYETPSGKWGCAPWTEQENDAALVMYRFLRLTGRLEMVLGGFSGRGTRCLAQFIRDPRYDEGDLWSPTITGDKAFDKKKEKACNVDLGVFIVKFELEPQQDDEIGPQQTPVFKGNPQVIRLEMNSLKYRAGLAV